MVLESLSLQKLLSRVQIQTHTLNNPIIKLEAKYTHSIQNVYKTIFFFLFLQSSLVPFDNITHYLLLKSYALHTLLKLFFHFQGQHALWQLLNHQSTQKFKLMGYHKIN